MAALGFEKAPQHVAEHLGVGDPAVLCEHLQLIGDLERRALVGGMLGLEVLNDGAQMSGLGGVPLDQLEQHVLLDSQMGRKAVAEKDRGNTCQAWIGAVGQAVGKKLQNVAECQM